MNSKSMGVKQKSIEDNIDRLVWWFKAQLYGYDDSMRNAVLSRLRVSIKHLPSMKGWTQVFYLAAVVDDQQMFFEVEYIKEGKSSVDFVTIEEVDLDTYLDAIQGAHTLEQIFNHEGKR